MVASGDLRLGSFGRTADDGELLLSAVVIIFWEMQQLEWILLLTSAFYALVANGYLLIRLLRRSPRISGGAIAHLGVALMVVGLLFSSSYSELISINRTGLIWHKDFPDEVNEENILLFQYQPRQMKGYGLRYEGRMRRLEGVPFYVPAEELDLRSDPRYCRAVVDLRQGDRIYARRGDTLSFVLPVKEYFKITYSASDESALIYPSAQRAQKESIIYSPYILRSVTQDLYAHVRTFSDPDDLEWSPPETLELHPRAEFFANDYAARILLVEQLREVEGLHLGAEDLALQAQIEVLGPEGRRVLEPILLIKKKGKETKLGFIWGEQLDLGLRIALTGIYPDRNQVELQVRTAQVPWVILEIVRKPLINLLWGGALLLLLGLGWTWVHRLRSTS